MRKYYYCKTYKVAVFLLSKEPVFVQKKFIKAIDLSGVIKNYKIYRPLNACEYCGGIFPNIKDLYKHKIEYHIQERILVLHTHISSNISEKKVALCNSKSQKNSNQKKSFHSIQKISLLNISDTRKNKLKIIVPHAKFRKELRKIKPNNDKNLMLGTIESKEQVVQTAVDSSNMPAEQNFDDIDPFKNHQVLLDNSTY